jgi:hypothetical protein
MRVNVYSQELTNDIQVVEKKGPDGAIFSGIMLMLHSSSMLHQPPAHTGDDDDRSGVTLWLPKSEVRRENLARTLEKMAQAVRNAPAESAQDREYTGLKLTSETTSIINAIASIRIIQHDVAVFLLEDEFIDWDPQESLREFSWNLDKLEKQSLDFVSGLLHNIRFDTFRTWYLEQRRDNVIQ